MKLYLFALFCSLNIFGCGICPDPIYIEYNYSNQEIEVLSKDYFIKNITLTQFIEKEGYYVLNDSIKSKISNIGAKGAYILNISEPSENYTKTGMEIENILKQKNIEFNVELEKFDNKKNGKGFDNDVISFTKENTLEKKKYNSKHPCP